MAVIGKLKIRGYGCTLKAVLQPKDITFGCDPEFELIHDGKLTGPYDRKEHYSDKMLMEDFRSKEIAETGSSRIGVDGGLVELRPEPSSDPEELYNNFAKLAKQVSDKGFKLSVRGETLQAGGHIHIGVPKELINIWHKGSSSNETRNNIVKALDIFVGQPIKCLNGGRRGMGGCNYGNLGNYHQQEWGIEYRVPPSALFHNKNLFVAYMEVFRKVILYVCNNSDIEIPTKARRKDYEAIGVTTEEYLTFIKEIASAKKDLEKNKQEVPTSEYIRFNCGVKKDKTFVNILEVQ